MLDIGQLQSRDQIPQLLRERGLTGWGVEVGVHLAHYSEVLLEYSTLSRLFSVDSWSSDEPGLPEGMPPIECFQHCARRLWKYDYRSVLVRQKSVDASRFFSDKSFDFVYIDANHTYEAVTSDIAAWWPKMKPGGIFAGHDFNEISPEVRRAVNEHCDDYDLTLHLTECDFLFGPEKHVIRSWLVEAR